MYPSTGMYGQNPHYTLAEPSYARMTGQFTPLNSSMIPGTDSYIQPMFLDMNPYKGNQGTPVLPSFIGSGAMQNPQIPIVTPGQIPGYQQQFQNRPQQPMMQQPMQQPMMQQPMQQPMMQQGGMPQGGSIFGAQSMPQAGMMQQASKQVQPQFGPNGWGNPGQNPMAMPNFGMPIPGMSGAMGMPQGGGGQQLGMGMVTNFVEMMKEMKGPLKNSITGAQSVSGMSCYC